MTIEQLTEQLKQRDAQIAQLHATNAELIEAIGKLHGELEWCKRQP